MFSNPEHPGQLLTSKVGGFHPRIPGRFSPRTDRHHFEPRYLPGYSPAFDPNEQLWLRLKADWFWDFIARTPPELSDRLCTALKGLPVTLAMNNPDRAAIAFPVTSVRIVEAELAKLTVPWAILAEDANKFRDKDKFLSISI